MADDLQSVNLRDRIGKIYKRHWLDTHLLGWVTGQRNLLPNVTIRQSIQMFLKFHSLTEDDISVEDCERTYHRMIHELFDQAKETSKT